MDDVAGILRRALDDADAAGLRRPRLSQRSRPEIGILVEATLDYLRSRPSEQSDIPGWTVIRSFDASVNRWWNGLLDEPFPSDVSQRLQTIRGDVYDHLEDEGHVVKAPGQTSPIHIAPRPREGRSVDVVEAATATETGAFFGDSATNKLVESAAMGAVVSHFQHLEAEDVSAQNCGWDITFRGGGTVVHAEVKGVSGRALKILLTRNEFRVAEIDPSWTLCIVTRALVDPEVRVFSAADALAAARPFAFEVDLRE